MNDRFREHERWGEGGREEGRRPSYGERERHDRYNYDRTGFRSEDRDQGDYRFDDQGRGDYRFGEQGRGDYRYGEQGRSDYRSFGRDEEDQDRLGGDNYGREEGMRNQGYGQGNPGQRYGQGNYGQERFNQGGSSQGRFGQNNSGGSQQGRWGQQNQRGMGQPYGMTNWPYDSEVRSPEQMLGLGESHWGKGPKGYQKNDERLKEEVSEKLTQDHSVDASEIEIQVQGGEVTLSGSVKDRQQKRRAEDCVEEVSGVKHVNNQLRITAERSNTQGNQNQGSQNQENQRSRTK